MKAEILGFLVLVSYLRPAKIHDELKLYGFVNPVKAATKIVTPDHEDPLYTDICYEMTRELCDFCCLVDFEFCARDIGVCEPVSDRELGLILHCVIVFAGILCGFPIIIRFLKCFMSYRCCLDWFPTTSGVSCYDLIMRCMCLVFCCVGFS